ncbi:MAG: hypothetical protein ACRC20_06365 [Segniliparus sp.]|uniref:hypothetical protein n=1 Tax=Segniliparus sp. TaxID=2804064 RepID=UPI003F4011AB
MAEDRAARDQGASDQDWAQAVADLNQQNARTREQFVRTRLATDPLWELWDGEAAILFGAEWELADGRARALLDEERAVLALLPRPEAPAFQADEMQGAPSRGVQEARNEQGTRGEEQHRRSPSGGPEHKAELFTFMQHAAEHFQAQQEELEAALTARDELIDRAERLAGDEGAAYAAEHRLWLKRAEDVVRRLAALSAGVRAARAAYAKAGQINTRMFRADFFAEAAPEPAPGPDAGAEEAGLCGQLSPAGFAALGDVLTAAAERLLKALISAELALEEVGPLARRKQRDEAERYDQSSQAVFLLAGDCLRAEILLARSVRQAGRNWEVVEWDAGGRRGALPEAAKVKEVVEMRIAPPPRATAQGREPDPNAAQQAEAAWRALAAAVDTLDKAVVASGGFDSAEAEALESAVGQIASRLYAVQDGATEIAQLCADLHARSRLPWWRRNSPNRFGAGASRNPRD